MPTEIRIINAGQAREVKARAKEIARYEKQLKELMAAGKTTIDRSVAKLRKQIKVRSLKGDGTVQIIRLSKIKVNFKPKAETYQIKIPADWTTRDIGVAPKQPTSISRPLNPSRRNWGRR